MEVNDFEILLIDVTFYVQKLVFDVLVKKRIFLFHKPDFIIFNFSYVPI